MAGGLRQDWDSTPPEALDALRRVGDPALDGMIAELQRSLPPGQPVITAIGGLLHHSDPPGGGLAEFFVAPVSLPCWIDEALLREGQAVFRRWSLAFATCLFTASLPSAYAAVHGAAVLARISDLNGTDVRRRIGETGQMLIDIHNLELRDSVPDADHQLIATARSVRAYHAAFRHQLLHGTQWDVAEHGVPINQEDLLGTLLTFTTVVFNALERLGIVLRPAEQHAYLHLWLAVGHLLGIDDGLMPRTVREARALQRVIERRQQRPSADGRMLTRALLVEMELSAPRGLRRAPRTIVRWVIGDDLADQLDVSPAAWWAPVLAPMTAIGRMLSRWSVTRRLTAWPYRVIGASMFRWYVDEALGGRHIRFRLTDDLARRWRLGMSKRRKELRRRRGEPRLRRADRDGGHNGERGGNGRDAPDAVVPDRGAPRGGAPHGRTPGGRTPGGRTPGGRTPHGGTPHGGTPHGGTPHGGTRDGGAPGAARVVGTADARHRDAEPGTRT